MMTLKSYALELHVEDSVSPILHRSINVTGGLNFLVVFGVWAKPCRDLGQDSSDMTYFFVFLYSLFPYY